jgi:hypothetical protein
MDSSFLFTTYSCPVDPAGGRDFLFQKSFFLALDQ